MPLLAIVLPFPPDLCNEENFLFNFFPEWKRGGGSEGGTDESHPVSGEWFRRIVDNEIVRKK